MKRKTLVFVVFLTMVLVSINSYAMFPDYSTPDKFAEDMQKNWRAIFGQEISVKYSEKLTAFVFAFLIPGVTKEAWTRDAEAFQDKEFIDNFVMTLKVAKQIIVTPFPDASIVYIFGTSENEIYYVLSEWAGIFFMYDNIKEEIIYTEPDSLFESLDNFF